MTAEVAAGYLTSSFSDPTAPSVGAPFGRGTIMFYPTQLVTVTLTGDEAYVDSGIPISPSYLSKKLQIQADYELLRNLIISANAHGEWNSYVAVDRRDTIYGGALSATYLVNRGLGLLLTFDHESRGSTGTDAGRKFAIDTLSLAVTLQR
jgi:hypothetical protein